MNPLIRRTTVVTAFTLSCAAALAAGTLDARVVSVDGGQVALQTHGPVPEWLTKGAAVHALGWQTRVTSIEGSKVVLTLTPARASKVQVDTAVVVREVPKQERLGC